MYTAFASVYDALMAQVDYGAWAAHYARLLEMGGVKKNGKIVECACGTGNLTLPLRKMGYQMTGVDLSEDMLERAMEKARRAGCLIPFIRQDMTRLQTPRRVDAVLATCDGVNYLAEPGQASAFFAAAYAALRPGGALIFDLSTPEKLSGTLGNHTLFSDEDEIAYIWQNAYDEKTALVRLQLSIFVRREDGAYDRLEEMQTQRAHSREEIRAWLEEAGFAGIRFFGRQRLSAPRAGDDRWHILALKPADGGKEG